MDCNLFDIIMDQMKLQEWLDGSTRYKRMLHNVNMEGYLIQFCYGMISQGNPWYSGLQQMITYDIW